jgi:PLP dependent protein
MSIAENLIKLKAEIPSHVKLIAISKTNGPEKIMEAYEAGQKIFGENKVQELLPKYEQLPKDIEWHMVGHLQSNKVKYIAPFVKLIHSVDSLNLLKEIDKQAIKNNRKIECMFEVYIASEETKFGLDEPDLLEIINTDKFKSLKNVEIVGLMGMASFTNNTNLIRSEFQKLKALFLKVKTEKFNDKTSFNELSMGMSSDYKLAIEEGSTMVRVGSKIFGERHYTGND